MAQHMDHMEKLARKVLKQLVDHHYEAYFVGGCVRDKLCNRVIKDYDIATSATPDQVIGLFPHTVATGLQHGTVTVVMDQTPFEVTTFRKEYEYERHRRPKQVAFITDIAEDLRRRDFTVNAMALDLAGNLIDPFRGREDLSAGRLRCVGDPTDRFREDGLRMMRCLRFAAEYELIIEDSTWQALIELRSNLGDIAMERIFHELIRMIEGTFPSRAMELLLKSKVTDSWKRPIAVFSNWDDKQINSVTAILPLVAKSILRWPLLFMVREYSSGETREQLRKLLFPRKSENMIVEVVTVHERMIELAQRNIIEEDDLKRLCKLTTLQYGKTAMISWLYLAGLSQQTTGNCFNASSRGMELIVRYGSGWIQEMAVTSLHELAVTGQDILAHIPIEPGPQVGELLHKLMEEVALGYLQNERAALLRMAQVYSNKGDAL